MTSPQPDILAQGAVRTGWRQRIGIGVLAIWVPALTVVTAFGIAPGAEPGLLEGVTVREALDLPDPAPTPNTAGTYISQEKVLRGDTVAALFERLGVRDSKALEFLRNDTTGKTLYRQLIPGRMMQAETDRDGELQSLRYFMGVSNLFEARRGSNGFFIQKRSISDAPRLVYKSATIRSSLFAATDEAGIPDAIAMQIARVFATDIDFHSDLRKGDRLSVVYDMIYSSGELVAPGKIVAAEFVNAGHAYQAVLFSEANGEEAYYSFDGSSRAKAFMRSPLEFSRVSSGFGARFHPIFRNWRAHTGVDFAAAQGTRVLATADGAVVAAGSRGGYGNAIEIRHGGGITTLYAHLSGFARGIRPGDRVHQGELIGYVGHTGFATGPHLHYEFKIAGAHQDPLRVALPKADPVPTRLKDQFHRVAGEARDSIGLVSSASSARFE